MKRTVSLALTLLCGCRQPAPAPRAPQARPAPPRITQFYAAATVTAPGEPVTVCYGVENARAVQLDPPVESLKPAYNLCFAVTPKQTTTYTLTASGDGPPARASFDLRVDPAARKVPPAPASLIQFFAASTPVIGRGQPVTLCYGVKGAVSVAIAPPVRTIEPSERACFSLTLDQTTTFTLTARSSGAATDSEKLTVTVR